MMRIRKKEEKQQLQTILLVKQTQQGNNSSTQLLIFDEQIVFKTVIVKNDSENIIKNPFNTIFVKFILDFDGSF